MQRQGLRRHLQGDGKELPVTIRLLDPPLHEFLPTEKKQFQQLAKETGKSVGALERLADQLREVNPMLGHRGCRLGLTVPAIYEMQATAIMKPPCIVGPGVFGLNRKS